ncbi:MAG: helix-turn-helix transcriptional regulator [Gemmatimonadetes bacterium]|nr:helix-turn-helix transcriptional regulator [Gemmatimonadota bacterium]
MSFQNKELRLPLTPLSFQLLLAIADKHRHGYGIVKEIELATDGAMKPATGAVYLAIQRMVDEGLICNEAAPGDVAVDERRRYYGLTELGRRTAAAEATRLAGLVGAAVRKRLVGGGVFDNLND